MFELILIEARSSRHMEWCAAVLGLARVGHQHCMWLKDSLCCERGLLLTHCGHRGVGDSPLRKRVTLHGNWFETD